MSSQPNLRVDLPSEPEAAMDPQPASELASDPASGKADRGQGLRLAVGQQAELLALLAGSVAAVTGPASGPIADLRPLDTVRLTDLAGGDGVPGADPLLAFGVVAAQFAQVAERVVDDLGGRAA